MIPLAEHQRSAVERLCVSLDRLGGGILADEPGMGKSFVAAEIARRSGRRVELIVPASLVPQWEETAAAFGLDATILTHSALASDPFAPDPEVPRIVIADEAHTFRNRETQRYAALARRSVGARLLLVTATPLCNAAEDLRALIDLIAGDDALAPQVPSIDLAFERRDLSALDTVIRTLVVRRSRHEIEAALRFGTLDRRVIRHPVLDVRDALAELRFPLTGGASLLRRFLWRRLESSEAALDESLRRQLRFYDRALECFRSGRTLDKASYRRAFAHEEDREAFQQVLFWDLFVAPAATAGVGEVRDEMARLDALRESLRRSPCEKRLMLLELIRANDEPMLIFTGSAATANDLAAAMPGRAALFTARERNRDDSLARFREGRISVLICTDLGAEGLNLQRAATVVHYDIPWNPVKLDQRNGRALRIGQLRASVRVVYFLPVDDDSRVMAIVSSKNRVRRRLLERHSDRYLATVDAITLSDETAALPPRVPATAAIVPFAASLARYRLEVPPQLIRRHRAGIEQLLLESSGEFLDEHRLRYLTAFLPAV